MLPVATLVETFRSLERRVEPAKYSPKFLNFIITNANAEREKESGDESAIPSL